MFANKSLPRAPRKATRRIRSPLARAKDRLWELCKQLTRGKYGNTCFTCGRQGLEGSQWQTGHFIPSSICGGFLRYDLRNLRPQCYRCNIDLSGNGSVFYRRLVEIEGQEYVDKLFQDKESIIKLDIHFVEAKILEYKSMLST